MKEYERLFGADRGTEIHKFIEGALGACPCRAGGACWTLLDVVAPPAVERVVLAAPPVASIG